MTLSCKYKNNHLLFFTLFLCPLFLFGKTTLKYSFEMKQNHSLILKESNNETINNSNSNTYTLIKPHIWGKLKKKLKYKFFLDYKISPLKNSKNLDKYINFPFAYIRFKKDNLKISAGYQTFHLGVIDIHSPLDTINAQDIENPLNPRPIGSVALSTKWTHKIYEAFAFYIPQKSESYLPGEKSFWLPQTQLNNIDSLYGTIYLPDYFSYKYYDSVDLNQARKNHYGFQIGFHLPSFDIYASYLHISPSTPQVRTHFSLSDLNPEQGTAQLNSNVELLPVYYKVNSTSFSFVKPFHSFILKGETSFFRTLSPLSDDISFPELPKSYGENGLQKQWQETALSLESNFELFSHTLTWQVLAYQTTSEKKTSNLPGAQLNAFEKTFGAAAIYNLNTRSSFIFYTLFDALNNGQYNHMSYKNILFKNISYELAFNYFSGNENSLFGSLKKISHISISLSYIL